MIVSEFGHVDSVEFDTLGDTLSADAAADATTLHVTDTADFDEDGGHLLVDGSIPLEYATCDGDPESADPTITLVDPLPDAASEGARVDLWDPTRAEVVTEMIAVVHVDGDDEGELVECVVEQHLIDQLPVGTRDNSGESVRLEAEDGEWRVVDVLGGAAPILAGQSSAVKFHNTDVHTVEATGDQAISLSAEPIPGSEHVYWGPLLQPPSEWSRAGKLLSVVDPGVEVDDTFSVAYAHLGPVVPPVEAGGGTFVDTATAISGLLAYYRHGESAGASVMLDASGNARDGNYANSPTLEQPGLLVGDDDTAIAWVSNSVGTVPFASWMNVAALSFVARVTLTTTGTRFLYARNDSVSANVLCHVKSSSGSLQFVQPSFTLTSTALINDGNAHTIGVTHDGTTARLYIDGVADNSGSAPALPTASTRDAWIGSNNGLSQWVGVTDEFLWYDNAIASSDMADLHAAAIGA